MTPERHTLGLALYLGVFLVQRVVELLWSRRNHRRVRERGGREYGASHFPFFVALHTAYLLALTGEVLSGAAPSSFWPVWFVVWLIAQALRVSAIRALGDRWNVRIVVVPGEPPVRRGIYRWLRHPNYLAVALEFIAAPLIFGAWRTGVAFSLLNAIVLRVRIPAEERALHEASGEP